MAWHCHLFLPNTPFFSTVDCGRVFTLHINNFRHIFTTMLGKFLNLPLIESSLFFCAKPCCVCQKIESNYSYSIHSFVLFSAFLVFLSFDLFFYLFVNRFKSRRSYYRWKIVCQNSIIPGNAQITALLSKYKPTFRRFIKLRPRHLTHALHYTHYY